MRIVNNLSTSDEAETVMMAKLQQVCGLDYTTRMMKLFADKNLSAEIAEQYRNVSRIFTNDVLVHTYDFFV